MVSHSLFEVYSAPVVRLREGQVEKNLRDARHRPWHRVPSFPTLGELNTPLEQRCKASWAEIKHGKPPGTLATCGRRSEPH